MTAKTVENLNFSNSHRILTIWVKNSVEIALSLTVSEILTFLGFPQKSKMAAKSGEKIENF